MKRFPRSFRRGHDDSLACPHRDVTCCGECAAKHVEIVEIGSVHFWVPSEAERAEIARMEKAKYAPLYFGDNGRITCLALRCAGMTAHYGKRDLSGQALERIDALTVRSWVAEMGSEPACEGCGAKASVLS